MFLFGDLNYRITLPNDVVRPALRSMDYELLKANDEMIQAFLKHGGDTLASS